MLLDKIQTAKPVASQVAARPTGMKRPVVRYAHDGMLRPEFCLDDRSGASAPPVFCRQRSCLAVANGVSNNVV